MERSGAVDAFLQGLRDPSRRVELTIRRLLGKPE
jgi:hypothetical protein